jgi:hypothetical protein
MLHKLAAKHLPLPRALADAVRAKDVAMSFGPDGTVAYVVRQSCPDRLEVLAAIARRKKWELWVAGIEGVASVVALVGLAVMLTR